MNLRLLSVWLGLALMLPLSAADTPAEPATENTDAPPAVVAEAADEESVPPQPAPPKPPPAADPEPAREPTPETATPAPAQTSATEPANPPSVDHAPPRGANDLRLNFRGVPLDMVLNYLSEAAGFIIVLDTEVKGKVDVWSNQPLNQDEAVELLNSVLNKNGYAAIRNGRTLTVVSRDEAKKRDIPVKSGSDPEGIPKSDEMVTQIVPVRYISAVALAKDLQPLLPTQATLTANEGGNALVITDTQTNIRRVAEIIAALDTSVASVSAIRVFPLRFADAKLLATTLRDLFSNSARGGTGGSSTSSRGGFSPFGGGGPSFFGGGPPGFSRDGGGDGGRSRSSSGGGSSGGLRAATQVTAVADEHSNSLIVSAPEEYMADIENLIKQVDTAVTDVTELRVFALRNADPVEMAELLSNLFPDPSRQEDTRSTGLRFGGGPFPGGFPGFPGSSRTSSRGTGGNNSDSERAKKQSRVLAVPDARTSSIIVTAAKDMMDQIAEMIAQLDSSAARKQKVFVYPLENANVQEVEGILRNLFETQNTRNTRTTSQQNNNPLTTRQNNAAQNQGNQNSTFGSGGLGGGGLGGGGGGGGFR
jgi:type II secretory pathway component GspD/PulD (secretin)